jgi:hypothetical protein
MNIDERFEKIEKQNEKIEKQNEKLERRCCTNQPRRDLSRIPSISHDTTA